MRSPCSITNAQLALQTVFTVGISCCHRDNTICRECVLMVLMSTANAHSAYAKKLQVLFGR